MHEFFGSRFAMPYTPLRKLKPEGLKNEFADAFNFDDLGSDDEIPEHLLVI